MADLWRTKHTQSATLSWESRKKKQVIEWRACVVCIYWANSLFITRVTRDTSPCTRRLIKLLPKWDREWKSPKKLKFTTSNSISHMKRHFTKIWREKQNPKMGSERWKFENYPECKYSPQINKKSRKNSTQHKREVEIEKEKKGSWF